ncbi:MAG: zinc-regulated TonB-dependent outer membrane receptor [Deltaproteobacteria bacterium]|nr:MAG: zinc-regulated TonB-dependent outer membrane receptor [Deltaproteobacteria bacterium]
MVRLTHAVPVGIALALAPHAARAQATDAGPPPTAPRRDDAGAAARPSATPGGGADAGAAGDGAAGDDVSPEELAEIEAAMAADTATAAEARPAPAGPGAGAAGTLNPDISAVLDAALAWFSDDEPLQAGGHDPAGNGFTFQQLELSLYKAVDPYFRLDAFIVFLTEGVEVEEAYATTLALPGNLQVRAGQMFTRFGRLNHRHPHAWSFADQPFVLSRMLSGEGQRGTGLEVSWLAPLPWYVELIGSAVNPGNLGGHGDHDAAEPDAGAEPHVHDLADLTYLAKVNQFFELAPDWSLLWGLSASMTRGETIGGTDLYLKYRPITRASYTQVALQIEALARRRRVGGATFVDYGGYGQITWQFARRWATGARYEYGSTDDLDADAPADRHRAAVSVTFWPTEFSRLRLQANLDAPRWREHPYAGVFATAEFVIGSHGAHRF